MFTLTFLLFVGIKGFVIFAQELIYNHSRTGIFVVSKGQLNLQSNLLNHSRTGIFVVCKGQLNLQSNLLKKQETNSFQ